MMYDDLGILEVVDPVDTLLTLVFGMFDYV
jgi:hypothetical protein